MNKYKLSKYITEININNSVVIYSLRTCKTIKISTELWEILKTKKINKIPEETINELIKLKILVSTVINEFDDVNLENNSKNISNTLYEVIMPSANCQMGCFYCGQNHVNKNISNYNIEKILNTIEKKLINGKYSHLEIGWFGGEPLIAIPEIKIITEKLYQLCDKFNLTYESKVVTNGLKLTSNVYDKLTKNYGVNNIEITIDGTPEFHNSRRNLKSNSEKDTFNKIIYNIKTILNKGTSCKITIRCNVDKDNEDSVIPLIDILYNENILNKISFYTAKIHDWGDKINLEHIENFNYEKSEINWIKHLLSKNYLPSLLPKRKYNVCLATNSNSNVYDIYGNVFKCTEIPYTNNYQDSKYFIGKIENYDTNEMKTFKDEWIKQIKNNETHCFDCSFYPVCGGACPKSWEKIIPCPSFKFNIKEKLEIYYNLNESLK
jgi:uncharacterized protein